MLNQSTNRIMKTNKKKHLPKGFLSTNDEPTQNAINMFFVYLSSLPAGWNIKKLNMDAIKVVRRYFGYSYGFSVMIAWGVIHSCGTSKTSSGRHAAMTKAYVIAQQMIGAGVKFAA